MSAALTIGPLRGGGLVLGWRCPSQCRHCLYACGPHRRDGEPPTEEALDDLLDDLAARAPHARWHIGGGEPFLFPDRLSHTIEGMGARGMHLEYVETNAAWVRDRAHAEAVLGAMADKGLACVLVSLSPFHAEHVPLEKTHTLIAAAYAVLSQGAFVWLPTFAADLAEAPPDAPLDLTALLAARGPAYACDLASRYGLVLAGRAGRYLAAHGATLPWRQVAGPMACAARLADTSHFHVDGQGRYVPGLCGGIAVPLAAVPGRIDLEGYPVLDALVRGGPGALVDLARPLGFTPLPEYAHGCDLCTHARWFLFREGRDLGPLEELGPPGFYDGRSIPDFA